jgi:hypothetical protein
MGILSTFLPRNRSVEPGGLRQVAFSETSDEAFARIEHERRYRDLLRANKPVGVTSPEQPAGDLSDDEYATIVGVGQTLHGYEEDRTAPARYVANMARLKEGRRSLDGQIAKLNGSPPDGSLRNEHSVYNNLVRSTNGITQRHRRAFDGDEREIIPLYPAINSGKRHWWQ